MSWFSRSWDGVHREACEQYEVENPPALADCQCPDIMVEEAVSAADNYLDQLREEQMQ